MQYTYNAGALTETVQKKESGGVFTNVVTDFDYSPLGQITYQANANNTATTNTYNQNALYRLTRKQTSGPGGGGGGGTPVTVPFYPVTGDGYVYYRSSWDTAHHATSGSLANYSSSSLYVRTGRYSTSSYQIDRAFLPFNTEDLPNDATITSAKLKVYVASKKNNDNDGDDWITVVQTSQATTTSLSTGDYDQCGSIHTPTEGINSAERKDITSIATGQFLTFNLNTTGLSWISKTGATRLGLCEGHDVIDSQFYSSTTGKYNELNIRTVNYSGTSYDPILEVTYTQAAPPSPTNLQDISYIYDAVGNITQITDASGTDTAKTTTYTYDDLHRLLTATVTGAANGDNTGRTYTYSAIGNILTASDQGTYLYEGTNYANPHATTKVGTAVYAYDNNGNLTGDSVWAHTWDYNNKLTKSQKTGSTVTYQYDHTGQRTKYNDGASGYARHYPNKLYNIKQTTATKHIYAGSQLIGTVEGTALQYVHTDHLTGSNAATNSSGGMVQLLDYYPYGSMRIDWKSGSFDEQRKFTGHMYDRDTELSYMGARYYDGAIGRFYSIEPFVLAVNPDFLINPQKWNSYSYVINNPLKYIDPVGLDSYVFYDEKSFSEQAQAQGDSFSSTYKTPVHMMPISTEQGFADAWNGMGSDGTTIEGVSLLFHSGGSDASNIIAIDASHDQYLTTYIDGKTPSGKDAYYLGNLDKKDSNEINLLICHSGDLGASMNIGRFFAIKNQTTVHAWDGSVSYSRDDSRTPRSSHLWSQGRSIWNYGRSGYGEVVYDKNGSYQVVGNATNDNKWFNYFFD
ncbi:MAG: RHS repeat-associated core domain-containing protein [Patescibacteria group bacterium]